MTPDIVLALLHGPAPGSRGRRRAARGAPRNSSKVEGSDWILSCRSRKRAFACVERERNGGGRFSGGCAGDRRSQAGDLLGVLGLGEGVEQEKWLLRPQRGP